jgi:HNH endonuclease
MLIQKSWIMPESRLTPQQKDFIKQRSGGCCEYCLSQIAYSPDPFSIEHIIPRSKGGTNDLDNLAIACQGCNNFKYSHVSAIDPITGESAPLYHPRQDRWPEHFTWSNDHAQLIGLTMIGRATIERLQLNREGVVNLRQLLCTVGQHPPTF